MKIQFCGGAQTVTGSQHLLFVNGKRILLECGLFQGRRKETHERNKNFRFDPASIDVMLLSHAHIDHSGNIPNLVRNGFRGPIYATAATVDLCQIMLRDSAYLQERDIEWLNRSRRRNKQQPLEPLYRVEDVEQAMQQFVGLQYDHTFSVAPGVEATFREAGHILGSASVLLEIKEKDRSLRLGFTGDLGQKDVPILRDPNRLRTLDVLIMESTYGNRRHPTRKDLEETLINVVKGTISKGGKIIIPAFALGRTQLLVYILHKLFNQNRLPDIPIFVDSPLATSATDIFRSHPECFDRDTYSQFLGDDLDPFGFQRLQYVRNVAESKRLNSMSYPHIIISASGMAEGGRVLHHLRNNLGNPRNVVLMVGFAAQHTLARRLMDGDDEVSILGERFPVRCQIRSVAGLSAHGDRADLLSYVENQSRQRLQHIYLVHGEPEQSQPLQKALRKLGFQGVEYPKPGQKFVVE